jgi:hypothetical protein
MQEWQVRLAIARIQRIKLPPEAWDETMQELALAIHRFKFDPNKAHAASQETIFCRLIDNRLRMLARKNGRHTALMERMKVMRIEQEDADRHDSALNDADVQRVLRRMTPRQPEATAGRSNWRRGSTPASTTWPRSTAWIGPTSDGCCGSRRWPRTSWRRSCVAMSPRA